MQSEIFGKDGPNRRDVVANGKLLVNVPAAEVMVEDEFDLGDMHDYPPGTVAFTPGYKKIWQMNGQKTTWIDMLGNSDNYLISNPDLDDDDPVVADPGLDDDDPVVTGS